MTKNESQPSVVMLNSFQHLVYFVMLKKIIFPHFDQYFTHLDFFLPLADTPFIPVHRTGFSGVILINSHLQSQMTAPHPSPLPRGERDGVRGFVILNLIIWNLFVIWCLPCTILGAGLGIWSLSFSLCTMPYAISSQTEIGPLSPIPWVLSSSYFRLGRHR
jgi:hypothetical protein